MLHVLVQRVLQDSFVLNYMSIRDRYVVRRGTVAAENAASRYPHPTLALSPSYINEDVPRDGLCGSMWDSVDGPGTSTLSRNARGGVFGYESVTIFRVLRIVFLFSLVLKMNSTVSVLVYRRYRSAAIKAEHPAC